MTTAGLLSTTDLVATVRASIRGDVVTADEPSFPAATFGVAGIPELVVVAADAADVARTVDLAGRLGRRVVGQVTGRPTVVTADRSILVVTRLLAAVRIDADRRTATVGIGASWRQVLDAAESFGLTALSAASDRNGVRRPGRRSAALRPRATVFAFAADRIRSFEVVTATGHRRLVEPGSPDFAALRRGQTAPGLVVTMTLDLVPHPALTVAELSFAAADAPQVLAGWHEWSARLPESAVTGATTQADGRMLVIRVAQVGDPERADVLLRALRVAVDATPMTESFGSTTVARVARRSAAPARPAQAA